MPCVVVPKFGELPGLSAQDCGMRLLVARSGLYVQIKLDWLDAVVRVQGLPARPPLPYGDVAESIRFAFGVIPIALLESFIDAGRASLPNEIAGALIFCRASASLRLVLHEALEAGPGGVRYRLPHLRTGESLAVDLHTHGHDPAFWSPTDDRDDQGIKVTGVFGDLHARQDARPSAAFRLVINGFFKSLPHPWSGATQDESLDAQGPCPTLDSLGFITLHDPLKDNFLEEHSPWNTSSTPNF